MLRDLARREFHVSRAARDRYRFDAALFASTGNVVFADFGAARRFARAMNAQRDLARFPEQAVRAGQINAMGLLDEIFHYVVGLYRERRNPGAMPEALAWLDARLGRTRVDATLALFVDEYPPVAVYRGELSAEAYLAGSTAGTPHRVVALEELLLLWLANANPALSPYLDLFDDARLRASTVYPEVVAGLSEYFATQPTFGPDAQSLVEMLRSPAIAVPYSLPGQLEYCLRRWGLLLGDFAARLLRSLDLVREEERPAFDGPGPSLVPVYGRPGDAALEPERFSPDRDWMPELVLMARHTYVWLDQLSRRHRRPIRRLDEIPDEELATLARRGFSGLWLIGLWERSPASRQIKQLCGNPEAVASAYSVFDYAIAADLGGQAALDELRARAARHGIRLASDMVPNHMSIDSKWVVEHPDWFISLPQSPFPAYRFGGPDLSRDPRVGIYLEDHYYDRTDAAVVFRRTDRWTGDERLIYHGNDGTRMPWNDTAQLDYLKPEVREAVIQTILHVARQFPIIRFDAAMTLAKQHYQRLWFPEPGAGGAIPSRAEHGLARADFDRLMPEEFWREVVDRVAVEAPDTLLLAEAFWLMEGYFVRTLGMHRVYNSAFMNMLRDEENAKYRSVIKQTLEFDPEILKRYVNFMNNPDEETAVEQFGKGDKYFGICTLLATLPGLPMFGHGQIEGFAEKYGMEYQRAYWEEQPDPTLVERHEREITPLLRRRHLFSGVESFLLYDLFTPEGHVDEDVFAYSNRAGDERALVVYLNRYATARGWLRSSAAYSIKAGRGDERQLVQRGLGEGLGLHPSDDLYAIFRDEVTGLEYIRSSREICERGLYVELHAYQRNVFLDFREVRDPADRRYSRLSAELAGRGAPSVEAAAREIWLRPLLGAFRELVNPGMLRWLLDNRVAAPGQPVPAAPLDEAEAKLARLLDAAEALVGGEQPGDAAPSRAPGVAAARARRGLAALLALPALVAPPETGAALDRVDVSPDDLPTWGALLGWLFLRPLGERVAGVSGSAASRDRLDEWSLDSVFVEGLRGLGLSDAEAWRVVAASRALSRGWPSGALLGDSAYATASAWLQDDEIRRFLGVNRFGDVVWFNQEALGLLLRVSRLVAAVEAGADPDFPPETAARAVLAGCEVARRLERAEAESGYQVDRLLAAARRLDAVERPLRATPAARLPAGWPAGNAGAPPRSDLAGGDDRSPGRGSQAG